MRAAAGYSGKRKEQLAEACEKLEHFQRVISQMMVRFFEKQEELEDRRMLASLCGQEYSAAEKEAAVGAIPAEGRSGF